jgi:hypothetical protein
LSHRLLDLLGAWDSLAREIQSDERVES